MIKTIKKARATLTQTPVVKLSRESVMTFKQPLKLPAKQGSLRKDITCALLLKIILLGGLWICFFSNPVKIATPLFLS